MYNSNNKDRSSSSHGYNKSRSTNSRGSSSYNSSRRDSSEFSNRDSRTKNRDFLTSPTPRATSDRQEREVNYNRIEKPAFERNSRGYNSNRPARRYSEERSFNRNDSEQSESRGPRSFAPRSSSSRSSGQRDNSYGQRSFSQGDSGQRSYSRSSNSRFGSRPSNSRFGNRGGRGGRFAKQLDESLFIQEAQPAAEQVEYLPSFVYDDLAVNNVLLQNIIRKGYKNPTPVQDQSIPHILEGKDLVGIANTGTGKTAAFLIPAIEKVIKARFNKILILVPTRELAEQIEEELFSLTRNLGIYAVKCIGGDNIQKQIYQLRKGYNFIIGTPGRVEDLIERRMINLPSFQTIVLDEVDRMLDMGFVDEIKEIIAQLPEDKQSLFFSATIDNKIESLMKTILKPDFVKVSVKTGVTSKNIHQNVVYYSDAAEKVEKLKKALDEYSGQKVLIFVNTKRDVDKLDNFLYNEKYLVTAIHGDKRQNYRKKAIDMFKSGRVNILVATDVAARGLDISHVALVLNFDIPMNHEDYIHRIGRTGRAGEMGNALTFVQRRR